MKTIASLPLQIAAPAVTPSIGVFDSGVGGLSVLRALRTRLPAVPLIYVGDVSHAPYGERPAAEVMDRCERIVGYLVARGARLIVVACNTATVLCIAQLRRHWPALAFVGVEPGVKPAAERTRSGRIAVMTTPGTAASARLRQLIENHARDVHVHVQACPGLAGAIEGGALRGDALMAVLEPCCHAVRAAAVDMVVLGCTHYPFVNAQIADLLGPGATLIDTGSAVAERVSTLWPQYAELAEPPAMQVLSTGATRTMQQLLLQCPGLEGTAVEPLTL